MESTHGERAAAPSVEPRAAFWSEAPARSEGEAGFVMDDGWYLRAYSVPSLVEKNSMQRSISQLVFRAWAWKKITFATCAGLCLGLGLAAFTGQYRTAALTQSLTQMNRPQASISTAVPAKSPQSSAQQRSLPSLPVTVATRPVTASLNAEETARLKARNRRLEALVAVLRQRTEERRPAPEQTTYLGQ